MSFYSDGFTIESPRYNRNILIFKFSWAICGKQRRTRQRNMPRVKRSVQAKKKRRKLLKYAKGFKWTRKSNYRQAKEALLHAWSFQFADRKKKKRNFRRLWQIQINAAVRPHNLNYSKFIAGLKKTNIELDRKILSDLAQHEPEVFKKIIETASE